MYCSKDLPQIVDAKPDMVFEAWAGATSGAMWQSLQQQGVLAQTKVVTGLGDRSTFNAFGAASAQINFLNHFEGAAKTDVNKAMVDYLAKKNQKADLFTPDGFVNAQLIVRAIEASGGTDVEKMIAGLEGWSFDAPKGKQTVRASDHAAIQPMYQVKLVADGANWKPELVKEIAGDQVAPPEKKKA